MRFAWDAYMGLLLPAIWDITRISWDLKSFLLRFLGESQQDLLEESQYDRLGESQYDLKENLNEISKENLILNS